MASSRQCWMDWRIVKTSAERFVRSSSRWVTVVLRFTADRVDAGRESWKQDIAYLFPPSPGDAPFGEEFLQKDVYRWLGNSALRPYTRLEEKDVAAGRADVSVTRSHRFVIEEKRELSNASRESLHVAYGGQAAAYSTGGPRISLEMVLDPTNHTDGVASLANSVWVDEVLAGGETRHVVMVVVRGNRPTPRQTKTGVAKDFSSPAGGSLSLWLAVKVGDSK